MTVMLARSTQSDEQRPAPADHGTAGEPFSRLARALSTTLRYTRELTLSDTTRYMCIGPELRFALNSRDIVRHGFRGTRGQRRTEISNHAGFVFKLGDYLSRGIHLDADIQPDGTTTRLRIIAWPG
ncbi:hypothetical protein BaRGS_00020046, partial [Batillaria attramentaria]